MINKEQAKHFKTSIKALKINSIVHNTDGVRNTDSILILTEVKLAAEISAIHNIKIEFCIHRVIIYTDKEVYNTLSILKAKK